MFRRQQWSCIDPDSHVITPPPNTFSVSYLILYCIHAKEDTTRKEVAILSLRIEKGIIS